MYFEAYQQSAVSKKAVAWVVYNRTLEPSKFATSFCGVITQKGQFPWGRLSPKNNQEWAETKVLARYMIQHGFYTEFDVTYGSTYFASKEDYWFVSMIRQNNLEKKVTIEGHRYYFWKGKK